MEEFIKQYLEKYDFNYEQLSLYSVEKVYHLFHDEIIFIPCTDMERLYLGVWYYFNKDFDNMKKYYIEASKNGLLIASLNLGLYFERVDELETAIIYFSLVHDKGDIRGTFGLAKCYKYLGYLEESAKYYKLAIESNPKSSTHCMINLISYYSLSEDEENMIKYLAISLLYGEKRGLELVCKYYIDKNKFSLAEKYLKMLMLIDENLAIDHLAGLYLYYGDPTEGIKLYRSAIERGNYDAAGKLGEFMFNTGKHDEAKNLFELGCSNGNVMCIKLLSVYYKFKQDYESSYKYLEMAAEYDDIDSLTEISAKNRALYFSTFKDEYYEKMKKYYLILLHKGIKSTETYINDSIKSIPVKKIVDFYSSFYDFLNDKNKRDFNIIITSILKAGKNDQAYLTKILCINCKKEELCVFIKCGHPICYCCYNTNKNVCSLCGTIEE